jgi:hypothetical protein
VQKALDGQGIAYEVVPGPWPPQEPHRRDRGNRSSLYPCIQFEDGSWYREESKEMARTIGEGRPVRNGGPSAALSRWPYS